jgi:hypothetical protein
MAASHRTIRVAGLVAGLVAGAAVLLSACSALGGPTAQVDCVGLPPGRCPGAVLEAQQNVVPGGPAIVSIRIRAVNPPCTELACQGETFVTFADGTTSSSSWDWQSAGEPPMTPAGPLPTGPPGGVVVPECRGVPTAKCAEFAIIEGSPDATPGPSVVRIEVTCTKLPCTDLLGMGTTVVTHEDGSRETSGWSCSRVDPVPNP